MKKLILGTACASLVVLSFNASAVAVSGQGTWETTLQGRDLDGNPGTFEAYYDTVLDITWLTDANYAGTAMSWTAANDWAASLNVYGINDWRLPTVTDIGNDGCNFGYSGTDCGFNVDTTTSEMSSMFYDTLGNIGYYDTSGIGPQSGFGLSNSGPFNTLQPTQGYWSATESALSTSDGWFFGFGNGRQNYDNKANIRSAWAVYSGDVSAVPVPAAVWLFGSGLIGLIGIGRRKALT